MQTLRHVVAILEYVKSKGIEVRFHGRGKNEASHYCGQCEVSKNHSILIASETFLTKTNFLTQLDRSLQHFIHS